jgi:hypothetical protein
MNYLIFNSESDATSFIARIDTEKGFPMDGTNIGDGIHAPQEESRILHFCGYFKHPTDELYAVKVDDIMDLLISGEDPVTLTSDWFPKDA